MSSGRARGVAFFFSSRRRHTIYIGDWSSDVCSSDLKGGDTGPGAELGKSGKSNIVELVAGLDPDSIMQIGRASCRERTYISVVAGTPHRYLPRKILLRRICFVYQTIL